MLGIAEPKAQVALFWADLRGFKDINDMHGQQAGDQVLAEIASRLRERMPKTAVCARFGSDEFLLLARAI